VGFPPEPYLASVGVFQQVGGKRSKQTGKILIFPNHKIHKLGILLGEFQLPSLLVLISHFLSYHTFYQAEGF
jgi:S-adenosylmethionine:tRNA-ribosyltransferase-isomerase (queuine synthetase)